MKNSHYYAFNLALLAIIPYLVCVGIKITKDPEDIHKVELTNISLRTTNDTIIELKKITKGATMHENEENNQQGKNTSSNNEPKIDPEQVIRRKPVMIKENKELPNPPKEPVNDNKDKE